MTAYYKMPGFTLARANLSTKLLITFYLVTVLVGLWVAFLQYENRAGTSAQDAAEWILGNEDDLEATEFKSAKNTRELLSLTHEHIFSLPMMLFLLLHLLALCSVLGERSKIFLYSAGFASMATSLGSPWLIAKGSAGYQLLMRSSGVVMFAVMVCASGVCLWELWITRWIWRRRSQGEPAPPEPMFEKLRQKSD